jgi:hypothetical protein
MDAVEAVRRLGLLTRARCRETFERRFSAERMARDYLELYQRIAGARLIPFRGRESGGRRAKPESEDGTSEIGGPPPKAG